MLNSGCTANSIDVRHAALVEGEGERKKKSKDGIQNGQRKRKEIQLSIQTRQSTHVVHLSQLPDWLRIQV